MSQQFYGLPPPESPDPEATPTSTIAMIGGLVFAALVFVLIGLGFVVGWWGPNAADDEVAEAEPPKAEPAETGEPEPVVFESAEQMAAPDQRKGPEALDDIDPFEGAEPVPEIAPPSGGRNGAGASGGSGGGGGAGNDAGARPNRVRVAFKLGDYEQIEIKLGGKVLKLASDRNLELPPGGYRVELRKGPDAAWKAAGLITLELGNRYRVTLLDPPLAKLEALK